MLKSILLLAVMFFAPLNAKAEFNFKGQKPEQIIEKLGKPDKVNSISKSQFQWIYGQSIVFFQDNLVIAWSDNGDLNSRANLAKIRDSSKNEDVFKDWKNPWTPLEKISKENIVSDLLEKSN